MFLSEAYVLLLPSIVTFVLDVSSRSYVFDELPDLIDIVLEVIPEIVPDFVSAAVVDEPDAVKRIVDATLPLHTATIASPVLSLSTVVVDEPLITVVAEFVVNVYVIETPLVLPLTEIEYPPAVDVFDLIVPEY